MTNARHETLQLVHTRPTRHVHEDDEANEYLEQHATCHKAQGNFTRALASPLGGTTCQHSRVVYVRDLYRKSNVQQGCPAIAFVVPHVSGQVTLRSKRGSMRGYVGAGMQDVAVIALSLAAVLSVGQAEFDRETRVAVSNAIQSKAQFEFTRALMSTLR